MKKKWIAIFLCIVTIVAASFGFHQPARAVASPPLDQPGPYKDVSVMNIYLDSTRSDYLGAPG